MLLFQTCSCQHGDIAAGDPSMPFLEPKLQFFCASGELIQFSSALFILY